MGLTWLGHHINSAWILAGGVGLCDRVDSRGGLLGKRVIALN